MSNYTVFIHGQQRNVTAEDILIRAPSACACTHLFPVLPVRGAPEDDGGDAFRGAPHDVRYRVGGRRGACGAFTEL